ncbi:hypothetical protein FIV00_26050 [Labrenzia sp. THAF82]|nr:hypothetical protein FIV00_26050 [Labrenzia sp. THAF82]
MTGKTSGTVDVDVHDNLATCNADRHVSPAGRRTSSGPVPLPGETVLRRRLARTLELFRAGSAHSPVRGGRSAPRLRRHPLLTYRLRPTLPTRQLWDTQPGNNSPHPKRPDLWLWLNGSTKARSAPGHNIFYPCLTELHGLSELRTNSDVICRGHRVVRGRSIPGAALFRCKDVPRSQASLERLSILKADQGVSRYRRPDWQRSIQFFCFRFWRRSGDRRQDGMNVARQARQFAGSIVFVAKGS